MKGDCGGIKRHDVVTMQEINEQNIGPTSFEFLVDFYSIFAVVKLF